MLLSIEEYRRLGEKGLDLVDRLSMEVDIHIDFEPSHGNADRFGVPSAVDLVPLMV